MPTASSLAWKTSPKSQDAVALQQIKGVALYLWLIVVISVRQSTVTQQYLGFTAEYGYGQFSASTTAWLQNSSEWTVREIDVWAESPRLSPLWLSASLVCLSWAVNHYRDNAITYKAQRDKNARELKLANAAITDMQMRQRDVAALDAKYTKELADAKAENDALRDDVAAGRRRLHQSSLSVSAWSHHRLRRG